MRTLRDSRAPRSATPSSAPPSLLRAFPHQFLRPDITEGDVTAGEDPIVRQAAIDALGNMNGTVVAIEPTSGRILAMVNQKLALSSGAQPCSTIKLSVALAALSEGADRQRNRNSSRPPQPHESYRSAGALQQRLLRSGRTQAGLRKGQLLRAPVRTRRTGRLPRFPANNSAPIRKKKFRPSSAASARCARSARASR